MDDGLKHTIKSLDDVMPQNLAANAMIAGLTLLSAANESAKARRRKEQQFVENYGQEMLDLISHCREEIIKRFRGTSWERQGWYTELERLLDLVQGRNKPEEPAHEEELTRTDTNDNPIVKGTEPPVVPCDVCGKPAMAFTCGDDPHSYCGEHDPNTKTHA